MKRDTSKQQEASAQQFEQREADEFSYLDKLEGAALEQALIAIASDPAKKARYLKT